MSEKILKKTPCNCRAPNHLNHNPTYASNGDGAIFTKKNIDITHSDYFGNGDDQATRTIYKFNFAFLIVGSPQNDGAF